MQGDRVLDYRINIAAKEGECDRVIALLDELSTDDLSRSVYAYQALVSAAEAGRVNVLEVLYDRGIPLDLSINGSLNALERAAAVGNADAVGFLLDKGVDMPRRSSLVDWAGTDVRLVKLLLSNQADIDARDELGRTPLIYAVVKNKADVVDLLISLGADIHAKDNNGYDAVRYATIRQHARILASLRKALTHTDP